MLSLARNCSRRRAASVLRQRSRAASQLSIRTPAAPTLTLRRLTLAPPRAHRRALSTAAPQTKNVALRLALAPYAALSFFPLASGAAALYHSINGDEDASRGCAFFSWTGWLSLPATLPMFLVAAPYTLLCDPYERSLPDKVAKAWGRCTTAPFFSTHVEGLEACEKQLNGRPAVFVANHQSWLDIYASFWLDWDRALKIVSKASIFRIPLCGWVMSLIGHVPYDRSKGGGHVVGACTDLVERGVSVFFFPEGTRSKDGRLKPFKPGAFVVAARAGCAVVPVTIKNTGYLMPVGDEFYAGGRLRRGDVTMVVHAPLYADPSVKDPVADLQERAREAIASRL